MVSILLGRAGSTSVMHDLWAQLSLAWGELHRRPPLAWLAPRQEVVVIHADGRETLWRGDLGRVIAGGDPADAAFIAVEVPANETLERRLALPRMTDRERESALALELSAHSPFPPEDLTWGWRTAGDATVAILTSRQVVLRAIDRGEARHPRSGEPDGRRWSPEVWAFDSDGCPVVLRGYGEQARLQRVGRGLGVAWALISLALILVVLALVTPTVQLKIRTMQAAAALAGAQRDFGPIMSEREVLAKALEQHGALAEQMEARVEPLGILDLITELVPDDTWLQRLHLRGTRLTISGQTSNTTALMRRLSDHPLVRDVRSPGAATRVSGGRENFVIEMTLLPQALRPASASTGQASIAAHGSLVSQAAPVAAMPATLTASAASGGAP